MRTRGFEVIKGYTSAGITLPERKTAFSAGYDIVAAETTTLIPGAVTLIPTGIKAYMPGDEYLGIHIRSGLAIKKSLSLINGQGIIDADYYDNPDNEGHIMIAVYNHGREPAIVSKGERIAQGIFSQYLKTDTDAAIAERTGGMGSTGI